MGFDHYDHDHDQDQDHLASFYFNSFTNKSFERSFGKSKVIRTGDRVLIAFSGGINSSAIIDMISDGLNEVQHKKLRFIPSIVFIDGILQSFVVIQSFIIKFCSKNREYYKR